MQDFPPGVAASSSQQLHPGTAVEPEDASDSDDSDSSSDSDSDSDSSDSDSEDDDEDFMPPLPEGPAPSKDVQQRHLAPSIPAPLIQPRIQGHQQQQPQFMQGTHYPPTYPQGMHGPPGYGTRLVQLQVFNNHPLLFFYTNGPFIWIHISC